MASLLSAGSLTAGISGFFLSVGVLLMCLNMILLTRVEGFLTLLFFMLFLRFSSSFFHPIGIGWISRTFKKDRLDWTMGIQSGFGDLGAFFAIFTTLFIADLSGWRMPLYIWCIIGVLILIFGLFITSEVDSSFNKNNDKKTKQNLSEALDEAWTVFKNVKILLPAYILSGVAWSIFINYFPLFLSEQTSLSLTYIGLLTTLWIGVGVVVSFSYSRIQGFFGRRTVIFFAYFIMGVSGLLIAMSINIFFIISSVFLLGVSTFLTYPALFCFTSTVTDETMESKTFGYIFTVQLVGGTLVMFISGILSDIFGIWVPFAILGAFGVFVTIFLLFYRGRSLVGENEKTDGVLSVVDE
ncbi:MAG: MFS transporter [Candidatus Thermoplasmatota archaeon]|nr:MFS transporter [Candidatus Thermoplasmatota archaeon]